MKLSEWMQVSGVNDQKLSERLGISRSAVTQYRLGDRMPRPEILVKLVEATDNKVSPIDLVKGLRMYRSKQYMEWINEVTLALETEMRPEIDYPFNIEIIVGRPSKRRMDIDNRAKAVMDVLQHCNVITDDCLANRVTMMWSNEIEGAKVTISPAEAF